MFNFYSNSVSGPVGSLSSLMYTTWAVISWTVPSYIPVSYPIIKYEIGYHVLDNCSYVDINSQLINLSNISNVSISTNITDLRANTCYLFGVRAYTINGYGLWSVIANKTLVKPTNIAGTYSMYIVLLCLIAATVGLSILVSVLLIALSVSIAVNVILLLYIIR